MNLTFADQWRQLRGLGAIASLKNSKIIYNLLIGFIDFNVQYVHAYQALVLLLFIIHELTSIGVLTLGIWHDGTTKFCSCVIQNIAPPSVNWRHCCRLLHVQLCTEHNIIMTSKKIISSLFRASWTKSVPCSFIELN